MPAIDADLRRLDSVELLPFRRAIEAGLDAVMTAHIALPRLAERRNLPATVSHVVLTDILRQRLGFQGVVMTDGLEMQGIVEQYGSGRAAVLAILAGADMPMILWMPKKKEEVFQAILAAVQSGEISRARLDESVRRILAAKVRRGLFDRRLEPLEAVLRGGNKNSVHDEVARRIAREAVTLVRNYGDVLPLRTVRYRKVAVLAPPGPFGTILGQEPHVSVITVPFIPSRERRREDVAQAIEAARDADLLVVGVINRYHLDMSKLITRALPHLPVAMVSFASPYYLQSVADVDAYVCTYSYLDDAQVAAAEAVLGRSSMPGRLPISIPGFYAYGHRYDGRVAQISSASGSVR